MRDCVILIMFNSVELNWWRSAGHLRFRPLRPGRNRINSPVCCLMKSAKNSFCSFIIASSSSFVILSSSYKISILKGYVAKPQLSLFVVA